MVCRVVSRLRLILPIFAMFVLLCELHPAPVQARERVVRYERSEGDPGDGVLDPASNEVSDLETEDQYAEPVSSVQLWSFTKQWIIVPPDLVLLPLYIHGPQSVTILPEILRLYSARYTVGERRWQHAP